jgi:uncharacterized protein (DUF2267 family)
MTTQTFYRTVLSTGKERGPEGVRRSAAAVLHVLRDRLTREEADQVAAQLPTELKGVWHAGETPERRPVRMHRAEFFERVRQDAGFASSKEAEWATLAVFAALKRQLSAGEAGDVLAQLPKDLKTLWVESQALD